MKLLVLLAARGQSDGEAREAAEKEAERWSATLPKRSQIAVMGRLADDPLAPFQPPMRPFEVAIEGVVGVAADAAAGRDAMLETIRGLADRLDGCIHADLSLAVGGSVLSVVPPKPTPFRYLYLMRRKAGTTHAQYLDHYVNVHAEFGRITPEIDGYEQLHVDEATSRSAAAAAGVGGHRADSVSELSIPDVDRFLRGQAASPAAREAPADEKRFVDRANSIGCCMEVVARRVV